MLFRLTTLLTGLGLALGAIAPAHAEQIIADNLVVSGDVCLGPNCASNDPTNLDGVIVSSDSPAIYFNDEGNGQTREWSVSGTSFSNGSGFFSVRDYINSGAYRSPFIIDKGAGASSIKIDAASNIGFGTGLPQSELHVMRPAHPALRLEQDTSGGLGHHTWDISAGDTGLLFTDVGTPFSITPMVIENGASPSSLYLKTGGLVGLGTNAPEGKLHTKGNGVQLAYFESGDGDAVQVRFRTDSENRRFLAVNNANQVQTQMQFRDDAILFLGQTVAQEWLRVDATGITTAGPTCGSPCDLTFDPEVFTVPPIEERASYMWQNMHLPAIGPTTPDRPINLTEKMGGVIHELEVAHIYIEQLHGEIAELRRRDAARAAQIDALTARLNATDLD